MMNQKTVEKIVSRIHGMGRGYTFSPKDFLDLASHETVRQILSRLTREGKIRRLLRGVYDYPAFSALLNMPTAPDPDAIAQAIARAHGWTIVPTGATALNRLGLSTQVPAQWQYYGDGPAKQYGWDGGTLIFKHRTNKETSTLSPKTALIVQAIKALGEPRIDEQVLAALRAKLDAKERSRLLKESRYVTSWVFEIVKRVVMDKKPHA